MGDKIYYSASQLGSCIKAQVAARMGKEPLPLSAETKELFAEGELHEGAVLRRLRAEGWEIESDTGEKECRTHWDKCRQIEVELPISGSISVVAHLDAVGRQVNHSWKEVLEVKSMGEATFAEVARRGWDAGGLIEKYKWQCSVQMLATGMPLRLVYKNRNSGEVRSLERREPFYDLAAVRRRVLAVEVAARRGVLPECDVAMFPCAYLYLHEEGEVERLVGGENGEVERLAVEYKKMQAREKAAKRGVEALRGELRKRTGGKSVKSGKVRVTWYKAKNPPQIDRRKLEEMGVDLEGVMVQTEGERLRVTVEE